jgi:hypothetical protein
MYTVRRLVNNNPSCPCAVYRPQCHRSLYRNRVQPSAAAFGSRLSLASRVRSSIWQVFGGDVIAAAGSLGHRELLLISCLTYGVQSRTGTHLSEKRIKHLAGKARDKNPQNRFGTATGTANGRFRDSQPGSHHWPRRVRTPRSSATAIRMALGIQLGSATSAPASSSS